MEPFTISLSCWQERCPCLRPKGLALYWANYHLALDDSKGHVMPRWILYSNRQNHLKFYRLHFWT